MTARKCRLEIREQGWDENVETRYFSLPYNVAEGLEWIYHVLVKSPRNHADKADFIPHEGQLNPITPRIKLGFIGDIMVLNRLDFRIRPEVKDFVGELDFLVGNFEGSLVDDQVKPVFMGQNHDPAILKMLADFFPPEKTVLSCANNHSGDYGWDVFNQSYQRLQDCGFLTLGRRDEPSLLIGGKVNITACTYWSNQPCRFVAGPGELDRCLAGQAEFNILFPHWGYEMQLYPKPRQVDDAQELLQRWDMIVGHHSHCPQPMQSHAFGDHHKLLAYSLGNFCSRDKPTRCHSGIILKLELGPDPAGKWKVGKVQWHFLEVRPVDGLGVELKLSPLDGSANDPVIQ
ncbi:MAG: CapA family protein [Methylococcaceae bacterium]|nr:CapA family protein [Methylococcaceae bacterium]